MRTFASWTSIVVGAIMVVAGILTWIVVSTTLADQKITTSGDACLPDRDVKGPFTAYCQADVIDKHVKEATGGKTYAELAQDDPKRETAMTGSFLQASLFTSVVAFGVAFMAVGVGAVFVLIGFGMRTPPVRAGGGHHAATSEDTRPA
ncbi:aromatic ring-opening dioxygenase LigA [Nocardioides guangzhouensis]|uniref:Aromatic ring-opening dioxygenase LigA n=1 Tax=Nocardioides guangzhouensis TaxID=2497878 RepID=A0A4Q4Z2T2_9ACTN|nr:aromatic ring-opening dioxygenase LigA [Nocardioides guangzhouensis]RYP81515.1 aromatic ring-opening dioxygenase LigA [Nocardioides guangzhouensis]